MVCCLVPCIRWVAERVGQDDEDEQGVAFFVFTEVVRWVVIAVPIFLSVWRYCEETGGYPVFLPDLDLHLQFWLVTSLIFLACSALLYLPVKLIYINFFHEVKETYGWRPSMLMYILMCALPSLAITLAAVQEPAGRQTVMDPLTSLSLQLTVMGLTMTEWMSKVREEVITYDLISAMATDFFFAYDVIDFFLLNSKETHVYTSNWLYVTFAVGFLAMFKYLPTPPTSMEEKGADRRLVACILACMLCNDLPFFIVRLTVIIQYGMSVSDLIHPIKNVALVIFGVTQLYIIYDQRKQAKLKKKPQFSERRCCRQPSRKVPNTHPAEQELEACECHSIPEDDLEPDSSSEEIPQTHAASSTEQIINTKSSV